MPSPPLHSPHTHLHKSILPYSTKAPCGVSTSIQPPCGITRLSRRCQCQLVNFVPSSDDLQLYSTVQHRQCINGDFKPSTVTLQKNDPVCQASMRPANAVRCPLSFITCYVILFPTLCNEPHGAPSACYLNRQRVYSKPKGRALPRRNSALPMHCRLLVMQGPLSPL